MKNTIILFLAVTTAALGVVCVVQSRKSADQRNHIASLQGELAAESGRVESLEAAQKTAERQRRELMGQAEELAAQIQARQAVATNITAPAPTELPPLAEAKGPDEEKGGFGKMLSKMMQDPDTRELIRTQQRMMMEQMYAPLVKKLGLTPEETTKFKDLLADNMMNAAEKASAMFGGSGSSNRSEAISSLTAQQKDFDAQVKAFLGDDRYGQYKEYEETMGERMMLTQFKQQAGHRFQPERPADRSAAEHHEGGEEERCRHHRPAAGGRQQRPSQDAGPALRRQGGRAAAGPGDGGPARL